MIQRVFCPNTDICSQISEIPLGLKFPIPTTYKPLLSERLLPINASLEEFHLIFTFLEMVVSLILTSSQPSVFKFSSFIISYSISPQCQDISPLAVFSRKFREESSRSNLALITLATFKSTFRHARACVRTELGHVTRESWKLLFLESLYK